jgi:formiminotetrahydrofolate cyclodeaminase
MTLGASPLSTVLAQFRSSNPTPGGGSAAALAGALGASLLAMVASLPRPRAASDIDLQRLRDAGQRTASLAMDLERLIDRDAEAYDLVVGAYRLPKSTDEEKAVRTDRIQAALEVAIDTPMDVMRACAAALEESETVETLGNANASSDVKVGIELLRAGLRGARLNAEINLASVKDRAYAEGIEREMQRLSGAGANESDGAGAPIGPS